MVTGPFPTLPDTQRSALRTSISLPPGMARVWRAFALVLILLVLVALRALVRELN
jgi:hypothetical protein